MSTLAKTSTQNKRKFQRTFVPQTAFAQSVKFVDDMLQVQLTDGRIISVPTIWFPILHNATLKEREHFEIGGGGVSLHWPEIDEDLSVANLLAGADSQSA